MDVQEMLGGWLLSAYGRKGFSLRVHAKSKAKMEARDRELTSRRTVNDYEKWKVDLKRYVVGWLLNSQPPTRLLATSFVVLVA